MIQQVCYPLGLGLTNPKGWPTYLDTVETLQKTHDRYALYVGVKQIYHDIGAKYHTLGFIKSGFF